MALIIDIIIPQSPGDTSDSLFMVSSSGVVSAVGVLDRETVDFYMINIAVSQA